MKTAISPREIASRLGIDLQSVYGLLSRGEIPSTKIGRKWLISRQAFERWEATIGEGKRQQSVTAA